MKEYMIKSTADLERVKNEFNEELKKYPYQILICSGAGCISSNCQAVKEALVKTLEGMRLTDKVLVTETGCIGTCDLGPVMVVLPEGVFYTKLKPEDIPSIVYSQLVSGKVKTDRTYLDPQRSAITGLAFVSEARKLRNSGVKVSQSALEAYCVGLLPFPCQGTPLSFGVY